MKYESFLTDNGYTIYLFHGVVNNSNYFIRNYTNKHILAQKFETILQKLSLSGTPLSINTFCRLALKGEQLPKNSFCITFDDGFENNYSVAMPIINNYKIPTVIYVTKDFICGNLMSWWIN